MKFFFTIFLIFFLPSLTLSQVNNFPAEINSKQIEMIRLTDEPVIDGVLDDEIWQQATLIEDLHQVNPFEFSEPTQRTQVWVYYTENAILIAAKMWDDQPNGITAQVLRQNSNLGDDDLFTITLDPFFDRRSGYRFATNPNGVRWDAIYKSPTDMEAN